MAEESGEDVRSQSSVSGGGGGVDHTVRNEFVYAGKKRKITATKHQIKYQAEQIKEKAVKARKRDEEGKRDQAAAELGLHAVLHR